MPTAEMYQTLNHAPVSYPVERQHHPFRAMGKLIAGAVIVIGSLYVASSARSEASSDRNYVPSATAQEAKDFGIPGLDPHKEAHKMDLLAGEADLFPLEVAAVAAAVSVVKRKRRA